MLCELFEKALKFYEEKYPKSFRKIPMEWNEPKKKLSLPNQKNFFEELKELTTEEKLFARYMLFYTIKEHNYKTLDTYYEYVGLRGRLKNLIPGGNILDKIENIEAEQRKKEEELIRLKKEYQEALQKDENERLKAKSTKIICTVPGCGKECNSPAGLASHIRNKHPKKEELE